MVALGSKVRDKVTGFQGVVTARIEYLYDPTQVHIESANNNGEPADIWCIEGRVDVLIDGPATIPTSSV
jgi:hypothetical protein